MSDEEAATLTVRPAAPIIGYCLMGLPFAGLAAGLIAELVLPSSLDEPVGIPIGLLLASVAIGRAFRITLRIGPGGVAVRNYFISRSLAWSDIEEVTSHWIGVGFSQNNALAFRVRGTGRVVPAVGSLTTLGTRQKLAYLASEYAARHGIPCSIEYAPDGYW